MPVQTTIKLRRDTDSNWSTQVLAAGEVGVNLTNGKFKIGDGTSTWTALPYAPSGLADRATSVVGGAAGSLPYQSGANTTTMLSVGASGQVLMSTGSAPSWVKPKLDAFANTTSSELRGVITDETGTGVAVFNDSPSLVTPGIGSGGAVFAGTSGTTTIKASNSASGTLTLPAETGTLITKGTADSTYVALAGSTLTGSLAMGTNNITGAGTVSAANVTATALSTAGIVTNTSAGVLGTTTSVPIANGGTGGTTVQTGREGLRIFVQATQPSSPQANDLWFW